VGVVAEGHINRTVTEPKLRYHLGPTLTAMEFHITLKSGA
jgi:hypothetical protein